MAALLTAVSAFADCHQNALSREHVELAAAQRKLYREWRKADSEFRALEKKRRMVDHKRHHVDTKVSQLSVLAELAALLSAFQMIVLYEIGLPDVRSWWPADALCVVWGSSCLCVAALNAGVMLIAAIISWSILDASSNEGDEDDIKGDKTEMYDEKHPHGAIICPEQFIHLWQSRYDHLFRVIVKAFLYSVPVFMANLGMLGIIRFYFYPVAMWTAFGMAFAAAAAWCYFQKLLVARFIWAPRTMDKPQPHISQSSDPPTPDAPSAPAPASPPSHSRQPFATYPGRDAAATRAAADGASHHGAVAAAPRSGASSPRRAARPALSSRGGGSSPMSIC